MSTYRRPFHHYAFKDLRYREVDKKVLHRVKAVLPKQEDANGRYLFEFVNEPGKREYLDLNEIREARSPFHDQTMWGS